MPGAFILNNVTGELSKAKPLDRETTDFYSLLVSATDHGHPALSSNATINITVLDVNDQRPEIYTQTVFTIPEVRTTRILFQSFCTHACIPFSYSSLVRSLRHRLKFLSRMRQLVQGSHQ